MHASFDDTEIAAALAILVARDARYDVLARLLLEQELTVAHWVSLAAAVVRVALTRVAEERAVSADAVIARLGVFIFDAITHEHRLPPLGTIEDVTIVYPIRRNRHPMPHRLTPTHILSNYIANTPDLDRMLRAGVRRAGSTRNAAAWLKRRIAFLMRPGRPLAAFRTSAKCQGIRFRHYDWADLAADLSYLSVHEFRFLLEARMVVARPAFRIQRYELVLAGTPEDDQSDAFGFVSINTEDGTVWWDGQTYLADVADNEVDISNESDLLATIEDLCEDAARRDS